ncbi:hypothetical protein [Nonomuraea guangzhouensis]|uniref:ABC transporter permease n=1 Tax=Nonomuraea guangzhouensis TaxID=1291555 RepID=A0ABW4G1Z5_9ACTN|nr:hypothetical protein [Nonomuraea guangzhouensis]
MTAAGVLRAEWTKFATIRSTTVLAAAIVAISTMFGWLFGTASANQYAAASAQDRLDFDPMSPATRGLFIVQLLVAGLGALVASSEYGSGTIRASAAAVGRRRLLTAKTGMTLLAALPVSVAAVWLMVLTCMATLSARGAPAVWFGDAAVVRVLTLRPLVLTLLALFGLALGFLMRATAAAVNVSTAFLLIPIFAGSSPGWLRELLGIYWPNVAAFSAASGQADAGLPPWAGFGILVGFTAVMLGVAFVKFESRDL